jgi:hypothetical protein
MVPDAIVELDRLPTTVSGKLDRSALSAPRPATSAMPPRTVSEKLLQDLFVDVLGAPDVAPDQEPGARGGPDRAMARDRNVRFPRFAGDFDVTGSCRSSRTTA